jgi:lipopolysaccharide/colanic/teichoic acid biosynthesis glycosyltransferase
MFRDRQWRLLIGGLFVADMLCVVAAFALAAWVSAHALLGEHSGERYLQFTVLMLPIFFLILSAQGLYDPQNLLGGTREYAAVFRACTYGLLALVLLSFVVRRRVSREWIVLAWALATILMGCTRFGLRRVAYWWQRRGHFLSRAIVVGADAHSLAMAAQLDSPGSGVRVLGFLDDYVPAGSSLANGMKVLGTPASLTRVAAQIHATEAVLVPQALPWETLHDLMTEVALAPNGLRVHLSAGLYDLLTTKVRFSERNHVPLLTVTKARLTPFESLFKASLDYVLATALLLASAPILGFVALQLRLRGGGPVFQRHRVLGASGRSFGLLTFSPDAPVRSPFVRKLPGLLNVLAGQISLVGPQPVSANAGSDAGRGLALVGVRPGLTGPWRQVKDPDEQAVLDLYYLRSYSIWLDLQVLLLRAWAHVESMINPRRGNAPAPTPARPKQEVRP